ncbi:hypothetical protein QJQ45_009689 [Haematococcus lacustris]|nr:hypothetical protein QJQ45_009689 [Haematococcus lacustris]
MKRKGTAKQKQGPAKKLKASPSPKGKQRQDRREGWKTERRQVRVIKVPSGAVLRGCKKPRRRLLAHLQLRAQIHTQLRVVASLFVLRISACQQLLTGTVDLSQILILSQSQSRSQRWRQVGVGIDPSVTQAVSGPRQDQESDQLVEAPLVEVDQGPGEAGWWSEQCLPHHPVVAGSDPASPPAHGNSQPSRYLPGNQPEAHHRRCGHLGRGGEAYLGPTWVWRRLRLYGAQDRALEQYFKKLEEDMVELYMERHGRAKHMVVFFCAAGIGTRGSRGADAVLRACCKVVCIPISAVNGQQPCEEELDHEQPTRPAGWKPPAGQVEYRLLRPAWSQQRDQPVRGLMWCPIVAPRKPPQAPGSSQVATQPAALKAGPSTPPPAKRSICTQAEQAAELTQPTKGTGKAQGKAAKAKPAPQPGRWLDRDCNAGVNMQRIGESRWRPLELCWWLEQAALPAKGKEYPGQGYKRVRDRPPKAQQQQQPVEAQDLQPPGSTYRESGITRQAQATKTWLTQLKPQLNALSHVSSKPSSLASYRRFADTVLETYDAMWAEVSKPRWANAKFQLYYSRLNAVIPSKGEDYWIVDKGSAPTAGIRAIQERVVADFWSKLIKQAKQRWADRILALAHGAAGFNGSGTIGCRGVPVSQVLKEALRQLPAGRVVMVDEF